MLLHTIVIQNTLSHLFPKFVGQSISHHGLASAWGAVEQHHHASTIRDSIIQTHVLATALKQVKIAHST